MRHRITRCYTPTAARWIGTYRHHYSAAAMLVHAESAPRWPHQGTATTTTTTLPAGTPQPAQPNPAVSPCLAALSQHLTSRTSASASASNSLRLHPTASHATALPLLAAPIMDAGPNDNGQPRSACTECQRRKQKVSKQPTPPRPPSSSSRRSPAGRHLSRAGTQRRRWGVAISFPVCDAQPAKPSRQDFYF